MAEDGFGVLQKVFAGKHIVQLSSIFEGGVIDDRFPQLFRNAVAISDEQKSLTRGPELDQPSWDDLKESCESILMKNSLWEKWKFPCLVTMGQQSPTACKCPFIPHATQKDWDDLYTLVGFKTMQFLLAKCRIFVLVGEKAWLQISGPLDKGGLEKNFPFRIGSKAGKRKRNKKAARPAPVEESLLRTSKRQKIENEMDDTASVVPQFKTAGRLRITRRTPVALPTPEDPQEVINCPPILPEQRTKKKTRRWRNKLVAKHIVDNRRAIVASTPIPHHEILYSSSGWTDFPDSHPLFRSSNEIIDAILNEPVGTECVEVQHQLDLTRLRQLVEVMRKNHRQCHYTSIFRRMLIDSNYDPKKAKVEVGLVYQFIKCVVKKVVPVGLLGNEENQRIFLSNIRRFVEAGRGTAFTLIEFVQFMRTRKCVWIIHFSSFNLQISLLARVIKWLFMNFIKPLIRQHLYATETTFGKNRIFFHSKDAWQRIHQRLMKSACEVSLRIPICIPLLPNSVPALMRRLKKKEVLAKPLISARLRFVPKKSGFRPIMSTKFREDGRNQINSVRLLLQAISGEYAEGMDAKSTHGLHRKWVQFKHSKNGIKDPIYFVHADIEDAYGSILHTKMVNILLRHREQLPRELEVRNFSTVSPDGRRSKTFPVIPHFQKTEPEKWVQRLNPGTVVFDVGGRGSLDTHKLIEFAVRSVREVDIAHGKKNYRLSRGIPQGSPLSSALCHIYYGQMLREHLSEFVNHPEDLLIRVVDDILYLTTCGERALAFHKRIHEFFTTYNARVNISKSATNLDLSQENPAQVPPVRKPIWFPFCGLQFNTRTLEIRGDYCRYEGIDAIHCITRSVGNPVQLLLKRLQGISTLKIDVSSRFLTNFLFNLT